MCGKRVVVKTQCVWAGFVVESTGNVGPSERPNVWEWVVVEAKKGLSGRPSVMMTRHIGHAVIMDVCVFPLQGQW